jgi:hypothetical protein
MVEVFKTNVASPDHAGLLLGIIHETYREYRANFDLDDCDRILRVECPDGTVDSEELIGILNGHGFEAETL